jgi:hypothetical protein
MSKEPNAPDQYLISVTPKPPWRQVVREALARLGGQASLQALYAEINRVHHVSSRWPNWQAKVRQQVQLDPEVERVAKGVWRLKSAGRPAHSSDPAAPTS